MKKKGFEQKHGTSPGPKKVILDKLSPFLKATSYKLRATSKGAFQGGRGGTLRIFSVIFRMKNDEISGMFKTI